MTQQHCMMRSMAKYSETSSARLMTACQPLRAIFEVVIETYDCTILQCHRSEAHQNEYLNTGRNQDTTANLLSPLTPRRTRSTGSTENDLCISPGSFVALRTLKDTSCDGVEIGIMTLIYKIRSSWTSFTLSTSETYRHIEKNVLYVEVHSKLVERLCDTSLSRTRKYAQASILTT